MDRFDKNFHDSDPETGRPFSYGHPDGVWIICLAYGAMVFGAVAMAAIALLGPIRGQPIDLKSIVPAAVALGVFGPYLLLFARRSKVVVIYGMVLAVVYCLAMVASLKAPGSAALAMGAFTVAQIIIVAYTNALKSECILK